VRNGTNMGQVRGQCGREFAVSRRKILPSAAAIAGTIRGIETSKSTHFTRLFALARRLLIDRRIALRGPHRVAWTGVL